jgi:hypothetical protein
MRKALYALLGAVIVLVRGWPDLRDNPRKGWRGAAHAGHSLWGWDGATLDDHRVDQSDPVVDSVLECL